MVLTDVELRSIDEVVGTGVFATRRIPAGTIVWVKDPADRAFAPQQLERLPPMLREQMERYAYVDHTGDWILCWDLAKYFNHSCEASCLGLDFPFELAVRDIEPGEELTDDYTTFHLTEAMPFACRCGAPTCRGRIAPEDAAHMRPIWIECIARALRLASSVPQPLTDLLPRGALDDAIERFASDH